MMLTQQQVEIPSGEYVPWSSLWGLSMEKTKRERLEHLGLDVEKVYERFMGNEEMIDKYLKRFITDKHYERLTSALNERDTQRAFQEAHALKGLCANLSLIDISKEMNVCVEYLRVNDLDNAIHIKVTLDEIYEKTIHALENYFEVG